MQAGESLDQWISILSGKKFKLGYGYHVVKNNPDPSVDHATARAEEQEFFQTVEPYATRLAEHASKFGILRLQEALSHKLTAQILTKSVAPTHYLGIVNVDVVFRASKLKSLRRRQR